ncbi:hypothetical protein BGE01nite_01490 [Brevifollis gellanilyticus]|uniref:Uncharacterized protein n=1 Tax=Brevifollis gellanilyticus TaxID=748831 RepID=A0A512M2C3_9BACT|nr:hypothetical protein BGE01nite_01490 [Brevifollis gellanilyticus]
MTTRGCIHRRPEPRGPTTDDHDVKRRAAGGGGKEVSAVHALILRLGARKGSTKYSVFANVAERPGVRWQALKRDTARCAENILEIGRHGVRTRAVSTMHGGPCISATALRDAAATSIPHSCAPITGPLTTAGGICGSGGGVDITGPPFDWNLP